MIRVPNVVARAMADVYGDAGRAWADRLPALLAECRERWSLAIGPPFPNLSYNYAASVTRADGAAAVLKAGFPGREFITEAEALRLFGGHGAVRLLEADLTHGVLLLERLEPGVTLRGMADDARATSIAAVVIRQLWRPAPPDHPFPTTGDWAKGLDRYRTRFDRGGPIAAALIDRAAGLFTELHASQAAPVLLHGDLHHDNILSAEREPWLAIDPKGVVGEPAYETGAFLRNPAELATAAHPARLLERRIAIFADELGLDRQRIHAWAVAQVVLSACWSAEDHGHVSPIWFIVADALMSLAP